MMLLVSVVTMAVPADKTPVNIKQPNGKNLTLILSGDERLNWANTLDGYTLLHDKEGSWVYAMRDAEGNMVPSSVLACNEQERSQTEKDFLRNIEKNMFFSSSQIESKREENMKKFGPVEKAYTDIPTVASDSILVILVNYTDKTFQYTAQDFYNYFAQDNFQGNGSVREYFYSQSGGKFDMKFRVVGPYTLNHTSSYYANNGQYLARDAINAADADVNYANFANVTSGNTNKVGCVFVMYAGTPQSSTGNTDEVWPHQSDVPNSIVKDGVRFSHYVCGPEKASASTMGSIGVMCHEFGHALGLPDYYDTYNNGGGAVSSVYSTGYYDLMCSGCYNNSQKTPPNLSASEKMALDWLAKMDTLTVSRDSIRLPVIKGGNDTAYLVRVNGTQEFFTVEARSKTGWDAYLPSAGILIHHGNWTKLLNWYNNGSNTINVNASDRGWFIESAVGTMTNYNEAQWAFVGNSNRNYFTRNSSNRISRANGTTPINDINFTSMFKVNDSLYMFSFNSETPMLETGNSTNITKTSFSTSGRILYQGLQSITAKGIVYSTSEDCPFVEDSAVYDNNMSDTINIASISITGLQRGTTYYYRSFIKNASDTLLGPIRSVNTLSGLGFVSVQNASNIEETSATLTANLQSIGDTTFVSKGFVLTDDASIDLNLDNNDTIIYVSGSSLGSYNYSVSGLISGQTYYVKAFVTNEYGTAYSSRISFQTSHPAITNNTITATTPQVCEQTQPGQITGNEPGGGFGNFTYLWQKREGNIWVEADGVNNQQSYQPPVLTDSTQFRRIVYSNGLIGDISNTVLIDVQISRGGVVNFANESVVKYSQGTFTLSGRRGDVVAWEKSSDNFATYETINVTTTSYTETFDEVGEFSYRVLVQIGSCPSTYSQSKTVTVLPNSSIESVENGLSFSVVPNPVTNGTFVLISSINNAERVSIVNVLGQVVYQEQNVDLTNKTFSLPNIDNGSYIIRVESKGKTTQQKIVINK